MDAPAVYEALATRKDEYVGVVFDWSVSDGTATPIPDTVEGE